MAILTREDVIRQLHLAGTPANLNLNRRRFVRGVDLTGLDLHGAQLIGASLPNANLEGVNLSGANLKRAYLDGANLRSANLKEANLGRNNLPIFNRYSRIQAMILGLLGILPGVLIYIALSTLENGASLQGANLSGVDLSGCKLKKFNLRSANLSGANLSYADLKYADLRNANFSQAYLEGTIISGARMSNTQATYYASGLSLQQVFGFWGRPIGQPRNSMAIAGLVLGILGLLTSWLFFGVLFCIPGIILSVVGMRRRGDRGKAITGLVLSIIGVVVVVTLIFLVNQSPK